MDQLFTEVEMTTLEKVINETWVSPWGEQVGGQTYSEEELTLSWTWGGDSDLDCWGTLQLFLPAMIFPAVLRS